MMNFKYIVILWSTVLLIGINACSQTASKKEYERFFVVKEGMTMQLSNKYGKMHIENWQQDKVHVLVTINVHTKSESKAQAVINKVKIRFNENNEIVSSVTEITNGINNTKFSIDYDVKMPKYLNVKLQNNYGDLFLDQADGYAQIAVKYGNFTINKLGRGKIKPSNYISVSYSNGFCSINQCGWLKLQADYSKVAIDKATALMIKSKYSSLKIKKSQSIVADSRYDKNFELGAVSNFVCTSAYSGFEIGKLSNMLKADISYSNFEVEEVDKNFEAIDLKLRYGKASFGIPKEPGYNLKAESNYGSVNYPHSEKISRIVDQTKSSIWGIIGDQAKPKAKVSIDAKYGTVSIDEL